MGKTFVEDERPCDLCVNVTRYGCVSWNCEYINRDEAIKAWREKREMADRKTEPNSSEIPNNCKDEPQIKCDTCRFEDYSSSKEPCNSCLVSGSNWQPKDEPTISKMEQVDKDINVRSKDEPQKKEVEWVYNKRERLWYPYSNGELLFKDEPQTETEIAKAIVHKMIDDSVIAEDAYPDLRQKMHDAVDEYEPQTDCPWK